MKSNVAKKPALKISLDKKALGTITKVTQEPPSSSKCSIATGSSQIKSLQTSASSQQLMFKFNDSTSTPNPSILSDDFQQGGDDQQKIIQFLLQENAQLIKQNSQKDAVIDSLLETSVKQKITITRANTSNTERSYELPRQLTMKKFPQVQLSSGQQKVPLLKTKTDEPKNASPLGFTFCNTEVKSVQGIRTLNKRLPKEFQIVPQKKKYFI